MNPVSAALDEVLQSIGSGGVCIGFAAPPRQGWRALPNPEALEPEATFPAIWWRLRGARSLADLPRMRRALKPRGQLLLEVKSAGFWARARALGSPSFAAPELADVCESLLRCGFLEPTMYPAGKRGMLLLAHKPALNVLFDVLFEQLPRLEVR